MSLGLMRYFYLRLLYFFYYNYITLIKKLKGSFNEILAKFLDFFFYSCIYYF
nr:MAG TPA: hypothetical protein [Caudoviricetes sp.]